MRAFLNETARAYSDAQNTTLEGTAFCSTGTKDTLPVSTGVRDTLDTASLCPFVQINPLMRI